MRCDGDLRERTDSVTYSRLLTAKRRQGIPRGLSSRVTARNIRSCERSISQRRPSSLSLPVLLSSSARLLASPVALHVCYVPGARCSDRTLGSLLRCRAPQRVKHAVDSAPSLLRVQSRCNGRRRKRMRLPDDTPAARRALSRKRPRACLAAAACCLPRRLPRLNAPTAVQVLPHHRQQTGCCSHREGAA